MINILTASLLFSLLRSFLTLLGVVCVWVCVQTFLILYESQNEKVFFKIVLMKYSNSIKPEYLYVELLTATIFLRTVISQIQVDSERNKH